MTGTPIVGNLQMFVNIPILNLSQTQGHGHPLPPGAHGSGDGRALLGQGAFWDPQPRREDRRAVTRMRICSTQNGRNYRFGVDSNITNADYISLYNIVYTFFIILHSAVGLNLQQGVSKIIKQQLFFHLTILKVGDIPASCVYQEFTCPSQKHGDMPQPNYTTHGYRTNLTADMCQCLLVNPWWFSKKTCCSLNTYGNGFLSNVKWTLIFELILHMSVDSWFSLGLSVNWYFTTILIWPANNLDIASNHRCVATGGQFVIGNELAKKKNLGLSLIGG